MDRYPFPNKLAWALVTGFLALANLGSPAADQPVTCGTTYTVASGDTLTALAARAYGNAKLAAAIVAANAEILPDPNLLSIGDRLLVPCLDLNLPQKLGAAVRNESSDPIAGKLLQPTGSIAPAISPPPPKINAPALRAVTAGNFPPFAGEALTDGGLIPDLVRRAIGAADDDREVIVGFVDDRQAHLENMLPSGAFDVSFPWIKPDCDNSKDLTAAMRQRCERFVFSRPIVELAIAYYRRADDRLASVTQGETLAGKRVCHVSGARFLDLENTSPSALSENAPTGEACFVMLKAGKVDIVALPLQQAEAVVRRMGIAGNVAEIDRLRGVYTLHAIALRNRPVGETAIALIDRGLESLMTSGDWFEVVVMHQRRGSVHW